MADAKRTGALFRLAKIGQPTDMQLPQRKRHAGRLAQESIRGEVRIRSPLRTQRVHRHIRGAVAQQGRNRGPILPLRVLRHRHGGGGIGRVLRGYRGELHLLRVRVCAAHQDANRERLVQRMRKRTARRNRRRYTVGERVLYPMQRPSALQLL